MVLLTAWSSNIQYWERTETRKESRETTSDPIWFDMYIDMLSVNLFICMHLFNIMTWQCRLCTFHGMSVLSIVYVYAQLLRLDGVYVNMYVYTKVYVNECIYFCVYICICLYIYIYINAYSYMYTVKPEAVSHQEASFTVWIPLGVFPSGGACLQSRNSLYSKVNDVYVECIWPLLYNICI